MILIILIGVLSLILIINMNSYKPFTWDGDSCVTYNQECICLGNVLVMESYPPQYACQGIEWCRDINEVECD